MFGVADVLAAGAFGPGLLSELLCDMPVAVAPMTCRRQTHAARTGDYLPLGSAWQAISSRLRVPNFSPGKNLTPQVLAQVLFAGLAWEGRMFSSRP
jgi:hypothetical protein